MKNCACPGVARSWIILRNESCLCGEWRNGAPVARTGAATLRLDFIANYATRLASLSGVNGENDCASGPRRLAKEINRPERRSHRGMPRVPLSGLLEGVSNAAEHSLAQRRTNELHAKREAIDREAAGH